MPSGAPGIKVSRLKDIEPISQRNSVISDREVIRCAEHGVRGVQTIVSTKQLEPASEARKILCTIGGEGSNQGLYKGNRTLPPTARARARRERDEQTCRHLCDKMSVTS